MLNSILKTDLHSSDTCSAKSTPWIQIWLKFCEIIWSWKMMWTMYASHAHTCSYACTSREQWQTCSTTKIAIAHKYGKNNKKTIISNNNNNNNDVVIENAETSFRFSTSYAKYVGSEKVRWIFVLNFQKLILKLKSSSFWLQCFS